MKCPAVDTAKLRLVEAALATNESLQGCPDDEILQIEEYFGIRLPKCYRDFLRVMGRSADGFLVGSDYSFPQLLNFRHGAQRLLEDLRSTYALSSRSFVFLFHQGYSFLYFDCIGGCEDPPVLLFTESEIEARVVAQSFSSWLIETVEDDISASRRQW